MINVFHDDCMAVMAKYDDNHFDLAVVDPPYGHGNNLIRKGNTRSKIATAGDHPAFDNSHPPGSDYFAELKRVSKNQIIWGANHFAGAFDSSSSGWIVWDKHTNGDFADCELAYSSFSVACRRFSYVWNGMHQGSMGGDMRKNELRIHPTQKPVALYAWIYQKYAKQGQKILDTHLGSGSSAIAAHYAGLVFTGCELSEYYYQAALDRIARETRQGDLF